MELLVRQLSRLCRLDNKIDRLVGLLLLLLLLGSLVILGGISCCWGFAFLLFGLGQ
jgi:hypothetical protein